MIVYINAQLNRWADWLRTGHTRLGYPSRAAFVAAMGGGSSSALNLPDDEAMAICAAVAALEPDLRATVECYYRSMSTCTGEQLARHLGCSRDTIYARLDRAHVHILGYLNDITAGIPVPPWSPPAPEKKRLTSPTVSLESV